MEHSDITQRVTAYGMEIALEEKYKKSRRTFEKLLSDSTADMAASEVELDEVKKEITKERIISDSLTRDTHLNSKEIEDLEFKLQKH